MSISTEFIFLYLYSCNLYSCMCMCTSWKHIPQPWWCGLCKGGRFIEDSRWSVHSSESSGYWGQKMSFFRRSIWALTDCFPFFSCTKLFLTFPCCSSELINLWHNSWYCLSTCHVWQCLQQENVYLFAPLKTSSRTESSCKKTLAMVCSLMGLRCCSVFHSHVFFYKALFFIFIISTFSKL